MSGNGLIVYLIIFGGWIVLSVPLGILVAKSIGWRHTLFPPHEDPGWLLDELDRIEARAAHPAGKGRAQ